MYADKTSGRNKIVNEAYTELIHDWLRFPNTTNGFRMIELSLKPHMGQKQGKRQGDGSLVIIILAEHDRG